MQFCSFMPCLQVLSMESVLLKSLSYVVKAPLATSGTASAATLHHSLSPFGGPISHSSGNPLQGQMRLQLHSIPPSSAVGSQIRTPTKKPLIGQKEPYEVAGPSTQLPRSIFQCHWVLFVTLF